MSYNVSYMQFIDQSGEPGPACHRQPDSPQFSYVQLTLK
ncbi:hypothetical protein LEP1GSC074_1433 [Leptospira noguchii str. Hook]|nr:hypothetical protein LEP1GSC074_1433 [Leptospira noguchii str. Hook]